ncbi:BsuBI/PstI family type II restriction endonuclease [Sphingobacterium sp. UDSM-2020]|uniref:BsuBI/PstI family type II restriction endonuclease n=1 Tax=Sphingobacterium sp. UDSM-2020 TaxID=2795738 RepID=UPI00193805C1|nr:BsuBI/PstI family type II restriction endonuclease [Sphingobacterium sp. UDSM-2020]QQD13378.1 hypothetical protein JAZ75_22760 [Sphingobacterium sp. UDSM-2020]
MSKILEAQRILSDIGLTGTQINRMAGLTLLALANITEEKNWNECQNPRLTVVKGIMGFMKDNYEANYAENSRESIRRQVLHYFVQANIVEHNPDDKTIPINSSRNNYALTQEFLNVLSMFGSTDWENAVGAFVGQAKDIRDKYVKTKAFRMVPVKLPDGKVLKLSAGLHNYVQKAIIEEFIPRFAPGASLLYLGDTAKKDLVVDKVKLLELGIPIDQHSKLPDVLVYSEDKDWIYLIEAVTTHGPVSQKRINELEDLFKDCTAGKVYVTAFPNMTVFKKYSTDIAWETEVWLMDMPEHMIHFNGDRFLGPR